MTQHCKYYKGEAACPLQDETLSVLWHIEHEWATIPARPGQIPPIIQQAMQAYFDAGLATYEMDDPTPISLRAYMFLRIKGTEAPITPLIVERYKQIYIRYQSGK